MKLLGVGQAPYGSTLRCDACNHPIKHLYYVAFDSATRVADMTVGCECVVTLTEIDADAVKGLTKNLKRAQGEWKRKFPRPASGEGREDYINRRLGEMRRSRFAYKELAKRLAATQEVKQDRKKREYREQAKSEGRDSFLLFSTEYMGKMHNHLPLSEVEKIARVSRCQVRDFAAPFYASQERPVGWVLKDTWHLPYWAN